MNRKTFLTYTGYLLGLPAAGLTSCKHEVAAPPPRPQPGRMLLMEIDLGTQLLNTGDVVQHTLKAILIKRTAPGNHASSFICFSLACTHSGCTINLQSDQTFSCPCHGSRFDAQGEVLAGPAIRKLDRFVPEVTGSVLRVWK